MTISLTSGGGLNLLGLGASLQISSSIGTGPTPAGYNWWITPYNLESSTHEGYRWVTPAVNFGPQFVTFGQSGTGRSLIIFDTAGVQDNSPIGIDLSLVSPTVHVDDTTISTGWKWQGDGTIPYYLQQYPGTALTSDQATQLSNADSQSAAALAGVTATIATAGSSVTATLGSLFSGSLLDALTLTELTSGPTCTRFVAGLAGSPFGLIIRCTTIPEFYPFTAPGDTWTPLDLVVATFIRGSDTLQRTGIHTATHMFYPMPGNIMPIGNDLPLNFVPPDYSVQIDPGNGVCFRVYGMNLP